MNPHARYKGGLPAEVDPVDTLNGDERAALAEVMAAVPRAALAACIDAAVRWGVPAPRESLFRTWPLPNVMLGVTVDTRKFGHPRIEDLRAIDAPLRWLSVEPLLEDVTPLDLRAIGWVVAGGESGPKARKMLLAWIRAVRDAARAQSVPFFVKQLGAVPIGEAVDLVSLRAKRDGKLCLAARKGNEPDEWPQDLRVQEFPDFPIAA